jgi:hypothetical protein
MSVYVCVHVMSIHVCMFMYVCLCMCSCMLLGNKLSSKGPVIMIRVSQRQGMSVILVDHSPSCLTGVLMRVGMFRS